MTNQRRGLGSRDPLSTNQGSPGHEERYEEQHGHPPADLVRESPRGEHAHTRAREEGEARDPVRRVSSIIISNNIIIIIINIIININTIIFILIINDTNSTITSTSPFSPFSFLPDHTHHYHKSSYHHHYNHHHHHLLRMLAPHTRLNLWPMVLVYQLVSNSQSVQGTRSTCGGLAGARLE